MKIAVPVKNGCINERFEDTSFFAILTVDAEKAAISKIIKVAGLTEECESLCMLLKGEDVKTVIAGDINTNARCFISRAGFEVISGASGEIEQIAYDYFRSRLTGASL